jgi:Secretion system C-terminal sorting domain
MKKPLPKPNKWNLLKVLFLSIFLNTFTPILQAQVCTALTATTTSYESRCAATGSIKIFASGGSGMYKYKVTGSTNTNYTTADSITGLSAGTYTIHVNDITTNCTFIKNGIIVIGDYKDIRFSLSKLDVTCENGTDGNITVIDQQYGRAPYSYAIIAPSAMGVGTTNNTGIFNNLIAGDYGIQMKDSCGGVQTRRILIDNYYWWINAYPFTKISCDSAKGFINVLDNKGNSSTVNGLPGFMYGIVRNVGDTIWSSNPTFSFYVGTSNSFQIVVKDKCGKIKTASTTVSFTPSVSATVAISNINCTSFTASLINSTNTFGAEYCLYNSSNTLISCNDSGIFNNIMLGNYCIKMHNTCPDTTITRCFSQLSPVISVGAVVAISNKNCTTFTATISNTIGLTNPSFCLYDNNDSLIICNNSGQFSNLSYAPYCIKIKNGCNDTIITRCFFPKKPTPILNPISIPTYTTCTNFGILITGDSLTNPKYCLYNEAGVLIICNNTGMFDSLYYGNYCVQVYDPCYDTTIIKCFTINTPTTTNDVNLIVSNKQCKTFDIKASTSNLINPNFCLYDTANLLIRCDSNGIFTNINYGTYCIRTKGSCPDTTMINCFTVNTPVPNVNANVAISNLTCTTFNVSITAQQNLTTPVFYLYNNNNVLIDSSTNGKFDSLGYGSYCIKIKNSCYDTIINRCFTQNATPVKLTANTNLSCSYGYAYFILNFSNGYLPVNVKIIRPNGNVLLNKMYTTNSVYIDSIPETPFGQTYKIIATDYCGNKDSINIGANASFLKYTSSVIKKCPSGNAANGSGDIKVTSYSNLGIVEVKIIKKNGISYAPALQPNTIINNVFTFNNLTNATYIIRYKEDNCDKNLYDTVTINGYTFPNLNQTSAYQCDVNGFSVGAVATGGVAPFTYEIIGSTPSFPSITTTPQQSAIFSINNGTSYSLIRLRAIDACGNGTLNDASILPLANTTITSSLNCFSGPTTLTVDSIFNAVYVWYKKENSYSTDSVIVGTGSSYYIPDLSPLDTGIYICTMNLNNGCINRINYIHVNGSCGLVLPTILKDFTGKLDVDVINLQFNTSQETQLDKFIIQKLMNNAFVEIGNINAKGNSIITTNYNFKDNKLLPNANIYRLKMVHKNGSFSYSNIIEIKQLNDQNITIFPNPVSNIVHINFEKHTTKNIQIELINNIGEVIYSKNYTSILDKIDINRNVNWKPGVYILKVKIEKTDQYYIQKIIIN